MMKSEMWNIEVNVEPSCNDDEYIVAIALDGPGNCAFHTLILTEKEAQDFDTQLRQAFDQIKRERGCAVRPLPAGEKAARKLNGGARAAHSVTNGAGQCAKCLGSGKIADDSDGMPWQYWEALPTESSVAVNLGLVKPIACPACGGKGGGNVESHS